jgi:predicted alpha/beta superfamily hydrolase
MRAQTRAAEAAGVPQQAGGGAPAFLDFMIDTVRPQLAADYRMDPNDNCLFGHSGGGMFAGFALFARPGAFSSYIIGSPSLYGSNQKVFKLEEEYAAGHDDLKANIFFGGSSSEIVNQVAASWSLIGSMVRLAELLALRNYPSTKVTLKLFPDESHLTVIPSVLLWGIRTVWADKVPTGLV